VIDDGWPLAFIFGQIWWFWADRQKFEALGSPYKIISAVSGNSKRPRYSALTCFASGSEA
jgi:hypothetical protein